MIVPKDILLTLMSLASAAARVGAGKLWDAAKAVGVEACVDRSPPRAALQARHPPAQVSARSLSAQSLADHQGAAIE